MYDRLRKLEYVTITGEHGMKQLHNIITLSMRTTYDNKKSVMYLWSASVEDMKDGHMELFHGRTLDDFEVFIDDLIFSVKAENLPDDEWLEAQVNAIDSKPIIHIYDHELSKDFQILRNKFNKQFSRGGDRVMARTVRKPIQAKIGRNKAQIIFHDTSLLVPKTLEEWAEDSELPVKKYPEENVGIITPETDLTSTEVAYSYNDNLIIAFGIKKYRDKYTKLYKIPVSQAGEVRRECQNTIYENDKQWIELCKSVTKSYSFDLYKDLGRAFIGGSVHTNRIYKGMLLNNVDSFDLGSAYPSYLASKKFPVSSWEEATPEIHYDEDYFYLYKLEFHNVKNRLQNSFWPAQKCDDLFGETLDDGNIETADIMTVTMTDIDFEIFKSVYDIESINVISARRSKAGYLPKSFIEMVLKYYSAKTELKGTDRKSKYVEAKTYNNCFYGVFVTRNITDDVYFKEDWYKINLTEENFKQKVEELCKTKLFTTYQIGVWVTAYCRQAIWEIIPELDKKAVYHDTDCIKGLFDENDIELFKKYNDKVLSNIKAVSEYYGIDINKFSPKTINGVTKTIGFFEKEHTADKFKAIGTKRYAAEYDGVLETTIAGLSKEAGKSKIKSVEEFDFGIRWNEEESGRFVTMFLDQQKEYSWTDRNGDTYKSNETFGISMIPTTFVMEEDTDDWTYMRILNSGGQKGTYFERTEVFKDL